MDNQFCYEDGHGNVVDEHRGSGPMDYPVDEETYVLETTLLDPINLFIDKADSAMEAPFVLRFLTRKYMTKSSAFRLSPINALLRKDKRAPRSHYGSGATPELRQTRK
ncbi:hypothetical protein VTP01DRAFT_5439 [Rhizomucor pusillus]|uniref:uncharacterized protein n=1 Tax=Rhizomucor pusillus TaxID=4840 RepID=UPI0037449D95